MIIAWKGYSDIYNDNLQLIIMIVLQLHLMVDVGVEGAEVIVGLVGVEGAWTGEEEVDQVVPVSLVLDHMILWCNDDIITLGGGGGGGQPNYMFSSGDWPCPRLV